MTYVIAQPCIGVVDHACVDVCPVDCIHEIEDQLVIDPEECICCAACVPECPVEAIFAEEDVPNRWNSYIEKNASAFAAGKPPKARSRREWENEKSPEAAAPRLS